MQSFDFSVVVAVYNVGAYLDEAVESIVRQSFPFERVQIVLVDDGSTDGSGDICDRWHQRYPDNILAVHKKNGGQSDARNTGLQEARGRYVSFMDSDDKLSEDTLRVVYDFFTAHEAETDVVAIPMMYFGAAEGEHWQNEKFKRGSRVIDLKREYRIQQASASSAFIRAEKLAGVRFDTGLSHCEDFKVMLTVMADKQTLGVVDGCCYWYRRRDDGTSTVQRSLWDKNWYNPWFDRFAYWAVDRFTGSDGTIPLWVEYGILCAYMWRVAARYDAIMAAILSEAEIREYHANMKKLASMLSDEAILAMDYFPVEQRLYVLRLKEPQRTLRIDPETSPATLRYGDLNLGPADQMETFLCAVREENERLRIDGFTFLLPGFDPERTKIGLVTGGEWYFCTSRLLSQQHKIRFDSPIASAIAFRGSLPAPQSHGSIEIRIGVEYPDGTRVLLKNLNRGAQLPVSFPEPGAQGRLPHFRYGMTKEMLEVASCRTLRERAAAEWAWTRRLIAVRARKALICRWAAILLKHLSRKQIWLISDRIEKADDNGEAFFRFLREKKRRKVRACFILSPGSPDYERLRKIGPVIKAHSTMHRVLSMTADVLVSSSARDYSLSNPYGIWLNWNRDRVMSVPYVFLQHGVTRDDISAWISLWKQDLSGIVTSADAEYRAILDGEYGYTEADVWLTGMPRFDRLYTTTDRVVTVMPTWRRYLMTDLNQETGTWGLTEDFEESEFCRFYHELLNDDRLLDAAKRFGYRIRFLPHPNLIPYLAKFRPDPSILCDTGNCSYRDIFAHSQLIITDYSSTFFDFAYLQKPVIYAQFDRDAFYGQNYHAKGYFKETRDGFGPVTATVAETVDAVIRCMENGCRLDPEYAKRIQRFFAFHDQGSCERVYRKICGLTNLRD